MLDVQPMREAKVGYGMGDTATVLGIVNGMIGGGIILLPLMSMHSGYITTIIVCLATGYICYYTAKLLVIHLGKEQNIRRAILVHFNLDKKYLKAYSFVIWVSFIPCFLSSFRVINLQIQGLLGGCRYQAVAPLLAVCLIIFVMITRIYHFGEKTASYGAISTVCYIVFFAWAQLTAPSGPKTIEPFGQPFRIAEVFMSAYTIHSFVAQNIVKNPNRKAYPKIIAYSFIIGAIAYIYFSMGSFALVNRHPWRGKPETIYDYFKQGQWQVMTLQALYLVHLLSIFPNFLIISKVQFFSVLNVEVSQRISWYEALYILGTIIFSFLTYSFGISLITLTIIYGSVLCYMLILVIPIWIHFKCVFYDKTSGSIEGEDNLHIQPNQCQCDNIYGSKFQLYLETFFLILCLIIGFIFAALALRTLFVPNHK